MKRRFIALLGISLVIAATAFPFVARLAADSIPFAHLVFAPFGSPLIPTIVLSSFSAWIVVTKWSPESISRSLRTFVRRLGLAAGFAWVAYATFWLLLYAQGGL